MSDYMGDLTTYLTAGNASAAALAASSSASSAYDLDMQDFLTLMVTELQNQSIDDTADTSEMINQMVQMQMITAINNLNDASIMSYAASLVGKTVTVGQYDSSGNLEEIVGEVTGTGTMGGEQVVFVNDKYYYMNEIMAVGVLPSNESSESADTGTENSGATDSTDTEYDGSSGSDAVLGGGGADTETEVDTDSGDKVDASSGVEGQSVEG